MTFNNLYRIFILLSLLMAFSNIKGQQSDNFNINDVTETIKINTDRDLYFSGEDIFFNADYFIKKQKIQPLISTVLYMEFINCYDNTPIIQKKYTITDFNVNGLIKIPKNIATGNYMLRAYTQYQRNFSPYNYSYHFLTILNPDNNSQPIVNSKEKDNIHIAPESNILLNNVKNDLVINIPKSLINKDNKYFIIDEKNNIIKEIKPPTNGFARIKELSFLNSKLYNLLIIKSAGDTLVKPFPKVQKTGIQTNIKIAKNNIQYKIQTKGLINNDTDYQISVFSFDYILKYKKETSLVDTIVNEFIPIDKLDYGINYFVLTDSKGNIEKINSVFMPLVKLNKIDIKLNKDSFKSREEINANITVKGNNTEELPIVSISVTRHGTKKEDYDFISALYLNNSLILQNFIENNNYDKNLINQIMILFENNIDINLFAEEINKTKTSSLKYIPEVRDLTISGILKDKKTKEPIANSNIYVSVLYNNPQIHICKTRENGEFVISVNKVFGINDVFICSEEVVDKEHEILLNNSFSSNIPNISTTPIFIDSFDKELIEELYINSQIQQKLCKKQIKDPTHQRIQTNTFNIDDEHKVTTILDNYIKLENLEVLFYEIVPNVRLKKTDEQFSFVVVDNNGYSLSGYPLLLIDNIPIFDPNKIMELAVSRIKSIEVIYKTYILGANTFHGIIMITTNTSNFAGINFTKSGIFTEYQALEKPNDLNNIYNSCQNSSENIPDFRTTLYWNNQFKLTNEKQNISFYASDRKGIYDIIIKGYTSKGQVYYGKKQIRID